MLKSPDARRARVRIRVERARRPARPSRARRSECRRCWHRSGSRARCSGGGSNFKFDLGCVCLGGGGVLLSEHCGIAEPKSGVRRGGRAESLQGTGRQGRAFPAQGEKRGALQAGSAPLCVPAKRRALTAKLPATQTPSAQLGTSGGPARVPRIDLSEGARSPPDAPQVDRRGDAGKGPASRGASRGGAEDVRNAARFGEPAAHSEAASATPREASNMAAQSWRARTARNARSPPSLATLSRCLRRAVGCAGGGGGHGDLSLRCH